MGVDANSAQKQQKVSKFIYIKDLPHMWCYSNH